MKEKPYLSKDFIMSVLRTIGINVAIVALLSFLFGGFHLLPNFFFFSAGILFVLSAFPLFSDGGLRRMRSARKKGKDKNLDTEEIKQVHKERQERINKAKIYGAAGLIAFLLTILSSMLF